MLNAIVEPFLIEHKLALIFTKFSTLALEWDSMQARRYTLKAHFHLS